jgi:hypothetical protein
MIPAALLPTFNFPTYIYKIEKLKIIAIIPTYPILLGILHDITELQPQKTRFNISLYLQIIVTSFLM